MSREQERNRMDTCELSLHCCHHWFSCMHPWPSCLFLIGFFNGPGSISFSHTMPNCAVLVCVSVTAWQQGIATPSCCLTMWWSPPCLWSYVSVPVIRKKVWSQYICSFYLSLCGEFRCTPTFTYQPYFNVNWWLSAVSEPCSATANAPFPAFTVHPLTPM